jgi:hypothetical protein
VSAPPTLERALAALPASHRRIVAENVGAAGSQPVAIAAVLLDEGRLEQVIAELPSQARAATTELAFAGVDLWSIRSPRPGEQAVLDVLERRGLAVCFRSPWSMSFVAPVDLVPALRRVRARAHARRIPDAPPPARSFETSEQLLQDVAAVGAAIVHEAIQIKADGDLYAKARPKLDAGLAPLHEGVPDFGEHRIDLALALLQELGALRIASDDLPGRPTRRTLQVEGDLAARLDLSFDGRVGLTRVLQRVFHDLELVDPLLDELAGRTVGLEALGSAVDALFGEARKRPATVETAPLLTGLAAVRLRILSGGAMIGAAADAGALAVTLAPPRPLEPDGPPCIAQSDFELVALRPLVPHERAALYLLGEPVAGREHVARLTRERIHGAARALRERDPDAILGRLTRLAGTLPQNVERAVADWVSQAPPRARLRSAIVVDLGDGELGDQVAAKLGDLVAERLAPNLLAVAAEDLSAVASALRRAGVELDPGLDRVSGPWREPRSVEDDASRWWRPSPDPADLLSAPEGRLVSGLDHESLGRSDPPGAQGVFGRLPAFELTLDSYDAADDGYDDELEPAEALIDAYESGCLVELRYAAADGTETIRGVVERIDGARFTIAGPDGGPRRWRWLKGLLEVSEIDR